jgi:putative acetyltransferase
MDAANIIIRPEGPADITAIRRINSEAFGRTSEADLVDALRRNGKTVLSLVAGDNDSLIGHVFFSPVTIEPGPVELRHVGLAPVAVLPEWQSRGVGSRLVRRGLDMCREAGFDSVVVLGHSHYYPRFGFVPASRFGLRNEYNVPDDVFMALELREGSLRRLHGLVRYQPEFANV